VVKRAAPREIIKSSQKGRDHSPASPPWERLPLIGPHLNLELTMALPIGAILGVGMLALSTVVLGAATLLSWTMELPEEATVAVLTPRPKASLRSDCRQTATAL